MSETLDMNEFLRRIRSAFQNGHDAIPEHLDDICDAVGLSKQEVIHTLDDWQDEGFITWRWGWGNGEDREDSILILPTVAAPHADAPPSAEPSTTASERPGAGYTQDADGTLRGPPPPPKCDINDYTRKFGFDEARRKFDAAKPVEPQRNATKNARAPIIKTAATLQGMTFAPLKYIVPGLIVEGLIILAGKPKARKSWFALDIGLAVAANRFCLGDREPEPGDVLYLALEDGERRLQERMTKLLPALGGKWPDRFHYTTQWPRADKGGVEEIDAWCETHPDARAVIIDIFARFRAPTTSNRNAYEQDYAALERLQKLATRRRIAILIVHHTRKGASDDPVEEISGTLGLGGGADGFLVLKRTASGGTLTGRCRDTDDVDLALQFSRETCRWTILGEAEDVQRSEHKGRVLVALEEAGVTGLTPSEIATEVDGLKHENAKKLLRRMAGAAEVRSERGRYFHNSVVLPHTSENRVPVSPDHVPGEGVCKNPSNPSYSLGEMGDRDTGTRIPTVSPAAHTPALEFLTWALTPGPRLVRDIEASARAEGLLGEHQRIDHAKSIQTAKQILGVVVEREGFGPRSKVCWKLPDIDFRQDAHSDGQATTQATPTGEPEDGQ
jgi:hypothetical protein